MKKFLALLMTVILLMSCVTANAFETEKDITVTYNGQLISFDTTPQIINDRTMVPFRAIFETIGADVNFDENTGTVSSTKGETGIAFKIGEPQAEITTQKNTETIILDAAPVIIDDRTLVPIRFVAESLGATVVWDDANREVVIVDTSVWKKEVKEKSEFLDILLNTPFFTENSYTTTEEAEMKMAFSLKNLGETYTEDIKGPENIDVSLNIKISEKAIYDTNAVSSDCSITADLSSLGKFVKSLDRSSGEDTAIIDSLLKNQNINIEIIVDNDFNVYLKSKEIVDLITLFDGGEIATKIGDNYILIPIMEIFDGIVPREDIRLITNLWDLIDVIVKVGKLHTSDVQMFEVIFDLIANTYSNDTVTTEKSPDGTTLYKINFTKEAYINMVEYIMKTMYSFEGMTEEEKIIIDEIIAEELAMIEKMSFNILCEFEYKDGIFTKVDMTSSVSLTDYVMPGTENVLMGIIFEMNAHASADTVSKVPAVVIPQNVIDITK